MNQNSESITPTQAGTPFEGGYYVGRIRSNGAIYALIVAPKYGGEKQGKWLGNITDVPGAASCHDGRANTIAMRDAGSELATWALDLQINGFSDWYLPSRDELELMYRNLKPTDQDNYCTFRDGDNPSSTPAGYPYTDAEPGKTTAADFQDNNAESLETGWYWASTQYSPNVAWGQDFDDGGQDLDRKYGAGRARAVRRFLVIE